MESEIEASRLLFTGQRHVKVSSRYSLATLVCSTESCFRMERSREFRLCRVWRLREHLIILQRRSHVLVHQSPSYDHGAVSLQDLQEKENRLMVKQNPCDPEVGAYAFIEKNLQRESEVDFQELKLL